MKTPPSRTAQATATSRTPDSGFSYSRPFFEELVDRALAHAKKLGATDAGAEASEGCGLSVSVRKGQSGAIGCEVTFSSGSEKELTNRSRRGGSISR